MWKNFIKKILRVIFIYFYKFADFVEERWFRFLRRSPWVAYKWMSYVEAWETFKFFHQPRQKHPEKDRRLVRPYWGDVWKFR